jgi:hypothetical protein
MLYRKLSLTAAFAGVAIISFAAGTVAQGRFPDINQAEGHLNAALGALHAARDIFGGHKVAAEGLIQQAIGELEAGKGVATSHGF